MEGKPKFRLQNTNSGLLLGSYDFGWGESLKWGLVCQGSLTRRFDSNFGDLLCKNLGFQKAEFIGRKEEFSKNSTEIPENCDLEFIISGANCASATYLEECAINDFRKHGGACIFGSSEIYVSCEFSESGAVFGEWSEWSKPSFCDDESGFIQRTRDCKTKSSSPASCEGAWLKLESCPSCNEPEINNQYNDYYYSSPEDSNYYESKTTESTKIRPKRSAEECFCNFSTSGNLKLLENNSGSLSAILFAAFGVFVLVGGFGYQKFKRDKTKKKNQNGTEKDEKEIFFDEKTAETRNELLSA
ncbi:unnamed protein product [Oikopleura dioica]|uniref:SRCR domain-containing protein n=1 Tax=Oikopleura dioica TaxID=34765 RepID=E4Y906_OIKDI|nr:unnamed protein product [Oikopleura dioica]